MVEIQKYHDKNKMIQEAAELFINLAAESIEERGVFSAALSGGSTPQPLYHLLGESKLEKQLDWNHIHLFFGDERYVHSEHPDSNFRMVKENLLDQIVIPQENVHRVPTEMDPRMAAFSYEEQLRTFFAGEWPHFDLILLGMGADGHTASLFPHSAGLNEEHRWFIANYAPGMEKWRLTLTKNAINNARQILVMVSGADKAHVLAEVLEGKSPDVKPIQLISPIDGSMTWMVDQDAGSLLSL